MNMNIYALASIGAVAFAFATVFLLAPLARLIPNWMESQLHRESAGQATQPPEDEHFLRLPGYPIYVTVAIGATLGFAALAINGATPEGLGLCVYFFSLLLLLTINIRHLVFPDIIVLPALGTALLFRALNGDASEFIYGAVAGYVVPYLINFFVRLGTKGDTIGYGDMKVFAMAGAWFGLASLPVLFGAFVLSVIAYASSIALIGRKTGKPMPLPSGPAHLVASLAVLLYPHVR